MRFHTLLGITFFILLLSWFACGSTTPGLQPYCQEDKDCGDKQICKSSVCVSKISKPGNGALEKIVFDMDPKELFPSEPQSDAGEEQVEAFTEEHPKETEEGNTEEATPEEGNTEEATPEGPSPVCTPKEEQACTASGKPLPGECQAGKKLCNSYGFWGKCLGQIKAQKEICDGKDNDCDGKTDEDFNLLRKSCSVGQGECLSKGVNICHPNKTKVICSARPKPSQRELCDGKDNDCDGKVDESFGLIDSLGKPKKCTLGKNDCRAKGIIVCSKDGSKSFCNAKPLPSSPEICDGKDNDCNGKTDENTSQPCYTGTIGTQGKGLCKAGIYKCIKGKLSTTCQGEVTPKPKDLCHGKDDNCNGAVGDGCSCIAGTDRSCGTDKGECKKGKQVCDGGSWSTKCKEEITPKEEICNKKDDNCDGKIDNETKNQGASCIVRSQKGICRAGTISCRAGRNDCMQTNQKRAETCNGKDDDCDGSIDERNPGGGGKCSTGKKGQCAQGILICTKAKLTCKQKYQVQKELCDGLDNNCDGKTDESFPKKSLSCFVGIGLCKKYGHWKCNSSKTKLTCSAKPNNPAAEICDQKDNDCDGKIDEDFTNLGKPCSVGKGLCVRKSRFVCSLNRKSTICPISPGTPQTEICDGKDNDCDGQLDEQLTKNCIDGNKGCSSVGSNNQYQCKGLCQSGSRVCRKGKWSSCQGQIKPVKKDACAGQDNNCNGRIGDGCSCENGETKACGTDKGECKKGKQTCRSGKWGLCVGGVRAKKELCDRKDNDCDGKTDEDFIAQGLGKPCTKGAGICKAVGKFICRDQKSIVCNAPTIRPIKESCNNKDDDCDGQVDEKLSRVCRSKCGKGTETCIAGKWKNCTAPEPKTEKCNAFDDDCDGKIDENIKRSCSTLCGSGTEICISGAWGKCSAKTPTTEVCDGKDNNCNGHIDEGNPGGGGTCAVTTNSCTQQGTEQCKKGKIQCILSTSSTNTVEKCRNNIDDDCDGKIDEICGLLYPYAIVGTNGNIIKSRGVKKVWYSFGKYYIQTNNIKCYQKTALVSVNGKGLLSASISCSIRYRSVYAVRIATIGARGSLKKGFTIVFPHSVGSTRDATGLLYLPCRKKECTQLRRVGGLKMLRKSTGHYTIKSNLCQTNRPIFTTPYSSSTAFFIKSGASNGVCHFKVYAGNNRLIDYPFVYWIPDSNKNAWMTIKSDGTILAKNDFPGQKARWSAKVIRSSQGFSHYTSSFPSWSTPSGVLVNAQQETGGTATANSLPIAVNYEYANPNRLGPVKLHPWVKTTRGGKAMPSNLSVIYIQ